MKIVVVNPTTRQAWDEAKKAFMQEHKFHINEDAFKRGVKDFRYGKKVPMTFSPLQEIEVSKRVAAIRLGNESRAAKLTDKLLEQHITLHDHYDNVNTLLETEGFYTTQADNPYPPGSVRSNEWQRGYDYAFKRQAKYLANLPKNP